MADADIIELLNGVDLSPRYGVDHVYLDNDGAPTDRFLEALKNIYKSNALRRRSLDNADLRPLSQAVKYRSYIDADDSSDSEGTCSDYSVDGSNGCSGYTQAASRSADKKLIAPKKTTRPPKGTSTNSAGSRKKMTRPSLSAASLAARGGRSGAQRRRNSGMILSAYSIGGDPIVKTTGTRARSASGMKSLSARDVSPDRNDAAPESPCRKEYSGDMHEKMRTYRLRLSGQLQTIRSLEVKLGEVELELRTKDTALAETRVRLQALERREKNSFLRGIVSDESVPALIPPATKERDAIRKLKAQIADLTEKLKEGNVKIRQGNERYKFAKAALDRNMAEMEGMKTNNAKMDLTLSDTQNALMKSRRENIDLSNQIEAYKGQLLARADAEETLQKDLVRAESTLRELRSENESHRADLNRQAKEIGYLQESNRRMELELRMLREKEAVHKLEKRALSKVITNNNRGYHEAEEHVNFAYDSEENTRPVRNTENRFRVRSELAGMDGVIAWEKDYARRRQHKVNRGESLSPSRAAGKWTHENKSSSEKQIGAENPSASLPPCRPRHPLQEDDHNDPDRYQRETERPVQEGLANAERIRQKHDRLQQMYARVTKGKGNSNVASLV